MQVEWMNHTGFIVSNMDQSLKFYTNVLGLIEERNVIMEGEVVSKITGFPDARIHIVYLGTGDVRHAVELIQYLTPVGPVDPPLARNAVGAAHLGFVVDDLDSFFENLTKQGTKFLHPPILRPDAVYPWAQKVCFLHDPDGNLLELIERSKAPKDTKVC